MKAFALAAVIAAMFTSPSLARSQEVRPQATVYIDYKGACGGTLVETRRRDQIERKAKKAIRKLLAEGRDVRLIVRNESLPYGSFTISGLRSMGVRFPVYNRNFSC
ncbi:hypothetical protein GCM10007897_15210 [Sphingobium jiangsuense]|uniref:Uncharacterized protein n=1 Tax=Sphingobium jiangsuense TaxID=870476 RepID=A0A7W6FPH3_9SPHN|nr:hypothetical protein [Sphingobium jiangsuense]MBB3925034.1 hypothetical protein [Sphingobium jiangsuense]GLT00137.1 hypothetical protein GCM10007897_15210 [Sphingobium jiangsuense]